MSIAFERLTVLKEYRTPRYFRAFSRVYVILFGMLYAPCTWAGSVGSGQIAWACWSCVAVRA